MKLFILLLLLSHSSGLERECHPLTLEKLDDVDYIIGGLIPAHLYKAFSQTYELNANAIAWASSIIYSVNKINTEKKILPDVKLGYVVRDTCSRQTKASNFSVEMMLDTKYLAPQALLKNRTKNGICVDDEGLRNILVGVVGGSSSAISSAISNLLSTDYIPQISYGSTSTALSNRKLYRSFMRTIPSDVYQAAAIAEILDYFKWTYVTAFASDDAYGRIGLEELREFMKQYQICLAKDMLFSSPTITERDKQEIFDHLETLNNTSHVVILWCQVTEASYIIQESANRGINGITWVGTETWGTNYFFRTNLKNVTGHVIAVDIFEEKVPSFENEFSNGAVDILCNNPWFLEFLKEDLELGLTCEILSIYALSLPTVKYEKIMASVYSLAYGLHKYLNCTETGCPNKSAKVNYQDLYHDILNVDFVLPNSNFPVKFDGDGEIRFRTYIYRLADLKKLSEKSDNLGEYVLIGNWSDRIYINSTAIKWGSTGQPKSICSEVCQPGYYKIDGPSECCWNCAKCTENTVTSSPGENKCKPCKSVELANKNHTYCRQLRNNALEIKSLTGIFVAIFSVLGVFIAVFIIVTYIVFWDTPVIKSSSRELSIIQVTSLLILFCLPILAYFPCTKHLCIFQTLIFGFCLSTVIAIIVVKTYRLLRVFNGRFSKVSRFLQNQYQIVFVYLIVFVQLIASVLWLLYRPIKTDIVIDKASLSYHVTCGVNQAIIFWTVVCYIFLLKLVSGYMAFRARKLPENFNEAQYICFSMFTACILWLMYIPLYFSLEGVSAVVAFLSINYFNTLAILLILYGYKLYIVLLHSYMNSPEYFRKTATKATVTNFKREIKTKGGGSVTRMMSVVTFELGKISPDTKTYVPARRYSIAEVDRDTPDGFTEIKPITKRRASFSSTTMLEKERIFEDRISIESLMRPFPQRRIKKSRSTPNILDLDTPKSGKKNPLRKTLSPPQFEKFSRSVSQLLNRLSPANSLSSIFGQKNYDELEGQSLLMNSRSNDLA